METYFKKRILNILILAGLMLLCCSGEIFAFEIGPGFFFYSNYELVKMADDILLVTPESNTEEHGLCFKVISSLEGTYKNNEITGFGTLKQESYKGASPIGDFSGPRPGAHSGLGEAYDFLMGKQYLIFVKKRKVHPGIDEKSYWGDQIEGDNIWEVGVHSLSRDREEVYGPDDPWVKAVEFYLTVAKLNNYDKEKAALLNVAEHPTRSVPFGLVDDIKRHFEAISPMKSYEDLVLLRNKAKTDKDRDNCVWAMIAALYPEAYDIVCKERPNDQKYFFAVNHPDRSSRWLEIFSKIESEDSKRYALELLLANVTEEEEDKVLPLINYVDQTSYSGKLLATWIFEHPNEERIAVLKECVGKDYKSKWRMAEPLAHLGDKEILDWAIKELGPDNYKIPVHVISYSPRPEALQAAKEIIESGESKYIEILRYAVIDNSNKSPNRDEIVAMLDSFEKTN